MVKYGIEYKKADPAEESEYILEQLESGFDTLYGRPSYGSSSFELLPSFISLPDALPESGSVLAIDAGGTHLRVAEVFFGEGGTMSAGKALDMNMPGFRKEISCGEFFDRMAEIISGYSCEDVGFCFSYAAKIRPDHDAEILSLSKEIYIRDIEGKLLGAEINKALVKRGSFPRRFTVLNDTVAVLLGSAEQLPAEYGCAIAMIQGTGFNICFQPSGYEDELGIINTEAGSYDGFPMSPVDEELDEASVQPGIHLTEKMTGGRYLSILTDRLCREYGQDKKDDIHEVIYDRAARYVTAMLLGILKYDGTDEELPSYVFVEGSTFMKARLLQSKVYEYVKKYIIKGRGIDLRIVKAADTTLKGAAAAAISTKQR